jgi:hypothetical protein
MYIDPRIRLLKLDTLNLKKSMMSMSRIAKINSNYRKKVVENSKKIGDDHILEVKALLLYEL